MECYDIDEDAVKTIVDFWSYQVAIILEILIRNPLCKYVYTAKKEKRFLQKIIFIGRREFKEIVKTVGIIHITVEYISKTLAS